MDLSYRRGAQMNPPRRLVHDVDERCLGVGLDQGFNGKV